MSRRSDGDSRAAEKPGRAATQITQRTADPALRDDLHELAGQTLADL